MPTYRGVTVGIVANSCKRIFPEFPHPDGTQYKPGRSWKEKVAPETQNNQATASRQASAASTRQASTQSSNASTSVYVPSIAGERFSIRWNIEPPWPQGQLYLMKISFNGRHIIDTVIQPERNPMGQISHGIARSQTRKDGDVTGYSPCDRIHMEFKDEILGASIAGSGGTIEVKMHRGRHKYRRNQVLAENLRPQDEYGIALKYGGPLERRKYHFYDVELFDPKNDPFVTFRMHYRSWESLEALSLIPSGTPRVLLEPVFPSKDFDPKYKLSDSQLSQWQQLPPSRQQRELSIEPALSLPAEEPWQEQSHISNAPITTMYIQEDAANAVENLGDLVRDRMPRIPLSKFSKAGQNAIKWTETHLKHRGSGESATINTRCTEGNAASERGIVPRRPLSGAPSAGSSNAQEVSGDTPAEAELRTSMTMELQDPDLRGLSHANSSNYEEDERSQSDFCDESYMDDSIIDETFRTSLYAPLGSASTPITRNLTPMGLHIPPEAHFPPPAYGGGLSRAEGIQNLSSFNIGPLTDSQDGSEDSESSTIDPFQTCLEERQNPLETIDEAECETSVDLSDIPPTPPPKSPPLSPLRSSRGRQDIGVLDTRNPHDNGAQHQETQSITVSQQERLPRDESLLKARAKALMKLTGEGAPSPSRSFDISFGEFKARLAPSGFLR